jgi:HK97 family phage portal protein
MAIVRSYGALQSISTPPSVSYAPGTSLTLYGHAQDYATIYKTQPNVRTVADFLSRNVAQLGLHTFRRVSETDRQRLPDHDLARIIGRPNPATTRYRLIESLMLDLAIYFNAYLLKVRSADGLGLVRLPPSEMAIEGNLLPTLFVWTAPNGQRREFAPSEVVHFGGYNPCADGQLMGLSPLETLRRILAEEAAAGAYREAFWANGARVSTVILRPREAPKWTPEQAQSFVDQWQSKYGNAGTRVGASPVLQEGMDIKAITQSAKDSEYLSARKLSREECAAAYHVPLPMVGILEHATFSNIKEQHKHLYQDCLGPWLEMITQEFERQVLPDCRDTADVYLEFNIAAKLAGSFEEQAASLQAAVGRPWMKVNEARARQNLPADEDPESDRIAPQQGGPSSAQTSDEDAVIDAEPAAAAVVPVIQAAWTRQRARLAKVPPQAQAEAFDLERWNRELASDLSPLCGQRSAAIAEAVNRDTLALLSAGASPFSPTREAAAYV